MIYNKTQRHKENVQKRITRLEIRIPRPSIRDDVEGGNRETAGGTTERHREALHEQSRISRATGKGRSYSREYHVGGRHTTHPVYNKTGLARQLSLRTGIGAIDGVRAPTFIIRNNSAPLVLVDGIERPMSSVEMQSVATISVLKDASATAVYGVKGANGVNLCIG